MLRRFLWCSLWADKGLELSLNKLNIVLGREGREGTFVNLCLALWQRGEARELFLYLLLLSYLQLKIIFVSEKHM